MRNWAARRRSCNNSFRLVLVGTVCREACGLNKNISLLAERFQRSFAVSDGLGNHDPGALAAKARSQGRLAPCFIFCGGFAQSLGIALNIEEVIGNLKCKAQVLLQLQ